MFSKYIKTRKEVLEELGSILGKGDISYVNRALTMRITHNQQQYLKANEKDKKAIRVKIKLFQTQKRIFCE